MQILSSYIGPCTVTELSVEPGFVYSIRTEAVSALGAALECICVAVLLG